MDTFVYTENLAVRSCLGPCFKKKKDEILGKENIRDKISKITKRDFDYFVSEEETKKFLKEAGFKSEVLSNEEIVNKLIEKNHCNSIKMLF